MKKDFQDIPIPKELDRVVEESMAQVYREHRRKRFRKLVTGCTATAAVFAGGFFFLAANPAMAAKLPLIGHVFETMQDHFGYQGDFDSVATVLAETETDAAVTEIESNTETANGSDSLTSETDVQAVNAEETGNGTDAGTEKATDGTASDSAVPAEYSRTADGLTFTLSEIYCNDQALYVSFVMEADEPFPEKTPYFSSTTTESYSFNPAPQNGNLDFEGDFLDDSTYAGMFRIDLNQKVYNYEKYNQAREEALANGEEWDDSSTSGNFEKYVETAEIPDSFTLDLSLDQIIGHFTNPDLPERSKTIKEENAMSDEEWHDYMLDWYEQYPELNQFPNSYYHFWYDGPWHFTLNVTKNPSGTQTIELNETNEQGIGIEKIVKTPFEITLYDTYPDTVHSYDYYAAILDADGNLLSSGSGGSTNTVAINGADVSTVDIFICDYMQWMDELKGQYWTTPGGNKNLADGRTFKDLLMENCVFHTEVSLEE